MFTNREASLRRATARTCAIIDCIRLRARWSHDEHESLNFGVPDEIGRWLRLCEIDNLLGDLCAHRIKPFAPNMSAPCRHGRSCSWRLVSDSVAQKAKGINRIGVDMVLGTVR